MTSDLAPTPPVPVSVVADALHAGRLVADRILDRIEAADGRPFLLGCPAGRTPTTTYAALGRRAAARDVPLAGLTIVMADEYATADERTVRLCDAAAHYSCRRYIEGQLLTPVNAVLPAGHGLAADRVRHPDPEDPAAYDRWIADQGGLDLYLLASGASDGHVAFNPPGTALDSPTRVVELASTTRQDNLRTFPAFSGVEDVPALGVTIGLRSITEAAEVVLVLLGAEKANALDRVQGATSFEADWPATVLHECHRPSIVVDEAAAGGGSHR